MPLESQVSHRNVRNTALPYKSNVSPTDTDPKYVSGSQNIMTSINGYAERRLGFADNVETTPTVFNNLQRLFTWDRNDGTFYYIACDLNSSNQAVVYKLQVGVDNSFSSIYTDTLYNPGIGNVFDFVTSNNTLYFTNGNVAKKWDPVNGVSNWGISIGSMNASVGPNACGTGASVAFGGTAWTNPGNITAQDAVYATCTLASQATSDYLKATNFGFSLPATDIVSGIQIDIKGFTSNSNQTENFYVQLLRNGTPYGTAKLIQAIPIGNGFFSFGGSGDLWGGTGLTYNDINQTTFGCYIWIATGHNGATYSIDFVRLTVFAAVAPNVTFTGTGLTASTGYQYVYCYGNSKTGHVSSPSPPSNVVKPTNQSMVIPVTHSTDAQVDQIRVFRSTDSVTAGTNAAIYFEIPTSPFANSDANITDAAADTALVVTSIAPTSGFNDPPLAGFQPVYYAGRIWLFNGNKVFFSSLEECVQGVPEESFVSGIGGNYFSFDQPVQALGVAGTLDSQVHLTFCGGRIYAITGTSLDTFRRFLVTTRRGCRSRTCISSMGGMVAWLDSSNQVWVSNGADLQEISLDIRPDLVNLTPSSCSLTFHAQGRFHWLLLADSLGGKVFVYDLDLEQWMPPWTVNLNYLFSGEIGAGNYKLMGALSTKAVQLSTSAHNDNGATYQPILQTNLFPVVPDFGNRFSFMAMGMYDEPSRTGAPLYFQVDTNGVALSDVKYLVDDDPTDSLSTFTSLTSSATTVQKAFNRGNGTKVVQNVYAMVGTIGPASRWIAWQIKGANADDNLKVYEFFTAYKQFR